MAIHGTTGAQSITELKEVFALRFSDILILGNFYDAIRAASGPKVLNDVTEAGINAVLGRELASAILKEYTFEEQKSRTYMAFLLKPAYGGRTTRSANLDR